MIAKSHQPPLEYIVSYLKSEGWKLVTDNERWYVFEGCEDSDGDAFEIILSRNNQTPDYALYIQQAVDILASLTDTSPEKITKDILRHDRDIFNSRITENADLNSTPLRLAIKVISGLKQLFICATDSEERDSKPFYQRTGTNPGRVLDEVRFGHTFSGSFGYSVESPVKTQTDLFKPPLQRRVMERIVRGLATTDQAAKMQDVQPLVDGYETGFSANMCDAILSMSEDHNIPIEYSIEWSRIINVSKDLRAIDSVNIQRHHFEYLQSASARLKDIQPEFVTIEGPIVNLRSPNDPQSEDDFDRKVTILWDLEQEKSRKLVVHLSRDEYLEAIEAHKQGRLISVKGYILGSKRQLSEPREFKIL